MVTLWETLILFACLIFRSVVYFSSQGDRMSDPKLLESRTVLFADLNKLDIELSIRAAISYYREMYGEPKRIWVNAKDVPDTLDKIDDWKIERRGGCARGKVMVM
jgi:hypothetical protein